MKSLEKLKVKIFSDGANLADFKELASKPYIQGFTTNPTLMKKAGITDYEAFVKEVMPIVGTKPISLEVFADDFAEMKRQALKLKGYGPNVYVKIPITNTKKESSIPLVDDLLHHGVKVNITAILTLPQVEAVAKVLKGGEPCVVSVFAGRIADTGRDPAPIMKKAHAILKDIPTAELLWASPRELLNIFHAEEAGCQIVTVPPDILKKLSVLDYDLEQFSLDTVKMFYDDAKSSGFKL